MLRGALLAAFFLFAALSPSVLRAQTISEIQITGNRSVDPEAIRSQLKLSTGSPYDPSKADQSLKALFATGLFKDVRLERRGKIVLVTVIENPVVSRVSIEGNSEIDKAKLEEQITVKRAQRYVSAKAQADAQKLRDMYRRKGRLTTMVEAKAVEQPDGRVDVVFAIKEGPVNKVDSITFNGNRAFTQAQLRDVISTSQSGWFDFLKSAAFYDPERLDFDKDLLRRHYLKHGFPDARVASAEAVRNREGTGYSIVFTIEEGERYAFGPAAIDSKLSGVDSAKLAGSLAISPGSPYNEELVEKGEEKLTLALSDQGRAFARVRAVPVRDARTHTMGIKYLIEEGPRITIERIDVVGNKKTKDWVIRREFRIGEGEVVNAFLIERGRLRLQKLGFFKSVAIKNRKGSAPEQVVLTIEVVEQETNDLSFGVGYSMVEGINGDISWTERNLLGNGQWLKLKLAGSLTRLQAEVGFTEPRFLGTDLAAGFDIFYKDIDYTRQSSYKSQKIGGDLRLGVPITEETTVGLNYTLVRNKLYDVGPAASAAIKEAIPGYPGTASNTYYTSSVGYSLTFDTRNAKRMPSSGVYYSLSQDLAGVGGDVRYIRTVADVRGYYPVSEGVTVVGRAVGGTIAGWGGEDVRLLDLFYRGGETVRGFATSGIGPRDQRSANRDALGGRMFYGTTLETLFLLPGVPESTGLRGAVFADAGSLWGVNRTAAALPGLAANTPFPRVSAGVGVAWDSPLGALRLDYAFPLVKQPADKVQPLSFGLMPF